MKIALLAPFEESVPPQKYGGTELIVYHLCQILSKKHSVFLFATGDSKTKARLMPVFLRSIRKEKISQDMKFRDSLKYIGVARVIKELKKIKVDIIHNHIGWRFLPFAPLFKCPTITTLHGPLIPPYQQFVYGQFKKFPFVSISNSQRKPLPGLNYAATVYNGIDIKEFHFNDKPKGNYFAFLARMSPEKGPVLAIKAVKKAGVKLKMAAKVDAVDKEYFEKEVKPLIDGKQIKFLGEIGAKEKSNFLGDARGLLIPLQWEEPFGLFMIEAMACLPKGQEIFNSTRLTPVEKVKDRILFEPAFKKFERTVNEKIIEIKPEFIPQIKLTKEHPVMVAIFQKQYSLEKRKIKKYNYVQKLIKFIWKKAEDIKIGDWLVFPKFRKENFKVRISDDLLYFYGWYVAEGCVDSNNIQIDLGKNELIKAKKLAKIISKNFKKYPALKETETSLRIRLTNSKLAKFLSSNFGSNGAIKRIPEFILKLPKEKLKIFLDAYIQGDGHHEKRNIITVTTVSKELAYQLILALTKLNILANICIKRLGGKGQICGRMVNFKKCWKISFSSRNLKSKKRYLEDNKNFYIRTKSLKRKSYSGKVFNFNTLSNTFQAPFILVHNCGTPVIVFNRGSAREVVKDGKTGFVVKTIDEMVQAIKKIGQIDRKECRKWVQENFTAERMVSNYEKIYYQILNQRGN